MSSNMNLPVSTHSVSIPSQVCFDLGLRPAAKLLYGEIAYRCREQGYCPLNKHYFAALYQVSFKTITCWIAQLEQAGYLRIRYDASGQRHLLYLEPLERH